MTSDAITESPNLQPVKDTARGRVIGGGATADQIDIIDQAVIQLRRERPTLKRAHFVVEAAEEKARSILRRQRATDEKQTA